MFWSDSLKKIKREGVSMNELERNYEDYLPRTVFCAVDHYFDLPVLVLNLDSSVFAPVLKAKISGPSVRHHVTSECWSICYNGSRLLFLLCLLKIHRISKYYY